MKQRLLSLDVFRGITVAMMILVNNPGDWGHIYWPLEHAEWNGCTPTDLVFPFFLFIVGVSISFAFQGKEPDTKTILKIIERSLKLFGLGLFLSLFPKFDISVVRIMGVLQRISIVFLSCSLLFIFTKRNVQSWILIGILILYYILMTFVPVPDAGAANLNAETNLGAYFDRLILGIPHLYKAAKVWDPEGLLSTLPAIGNGIWGMLAGQYMQRKDQEASVKLLNLFLVGCTGMLIGWAWDSAGFPINKALWTSSYVCWTAGMATCFWAGFYWLIDIKGYQQWTKPFVVYGVNAITVFFLSGLIPRILRMIKVHTADGEEVNLQVYLYKSWIVPLFQSPYNASLAGAIILVSLWCGILWIMYNKKIIVKV
jgi:predicted acyltransferase